MTPEPSSGSIDFPSFLARLQAGDSDATQKLFDDYSRKLIQLAASNIHPALLKRFDGEDVVQSVFRSFYRRQQEGRFEIEHSQQLWQLLVTLTLCKTRSHARRHTAMQRDATADFAVTDANQILDHNPSSVEAIALWEEIDFVLDGLPDRTAEIISMRLEGRARTEIAESLGLSRQSIHRILKLVEERLQGRFERYSK